MLFHIPRFLRRIAEMARAEQETAQPRLHVRWMIRRDMPAVLAIEAASFEFPWSRDDLIRVLRQRNHIGMVAEDLSLQRVAGFMVYQILPARLHLLNLAVDPAYSRGGVGRAMVDKLAFKLSPRRTAIYADVRERNLGAQLFFRDMGFRAVAVLRDTFEDTDEDAFRFRLTRGQLLGARPRFQVPKGTGHEG